MSNGVKDVRRSRCRGRHTDIDESGHGCGFNGRQTLRGSYPIEAESSPELPFFKERPDEPFDQHYCGCGGWN